MAIHQVSSGVTRPRYGHLSTPDPSWAAVAEQQKIFDENAKKMYDLPIEQFRKVPYKPSDLPQNAPVEGKDILIREIYVKVRDGSEVLARIYQPVDISSDHVLFFNTHGGGWMVGSPQTEEGQNRFICFRNRAVVVSVDYRRAPEYPFPYALHDSIDVFEWAQRPEIAHELGIDTNRMIVGGGSAGANLAAVIAQTYRDNGKQGIIGQVLNIPVTCHPDHFPVTKFEYTSYDQNDDAPIVNADRMRMFWRYYLPSATPDRRANPLLAESFNNLPPALVQVAGMDPLRDEGIAYAEALKLEGVDVTLKLYSGLPHAFYVYPNISATLQYFEEVVDWIEQIKSRKH